jgi:predicted TIM-barrel fold metal-dependent hydrolase
MMRRDAFTRRTVIAGLAALAAAPSGAFAEESVPWSAGTEKPTLAAPPNTADCHHHIYDSRFPIAANAVLRPADATVAMYRLLQQRIGTTRHVIVQPSTYGVDNRCLLDALAQFGQATARGVAVVNTEVTDAELKQLHAAGVRGIRFNLAPPGATTFAMVEPLARRVQPLGWHIQVHAPGAVIVEHAALWESQPCEVVFDHMARIRPELGVHDPAFALASRLMQKGKAWVKLSGAYLNSKVGPPTYADCTVVAQTYVKEAPERLVWGSDWPHPTEKVKPDDAILFDLLAQWVPDEATRTRVLVDNAGRLYGFG